MPNSQKSVLSFAAALLLLSCAFAELGAQSTALLNPMRERATRSELLAIAREADSLANIADSKKERGVQEARAAAARTRLREGDMRVGDQVVVEVVNYPDINDTLTVRTGQMLEIPQFPALPLRGVLRAELDSHLTAQISKYYVNPQVRSIPMIRLAISGGVNASGFKYARMDAILSDVINLAGGFSPDGSTNKIRIRRGAEVRWTPDQATIALRDGWTLDSLQLIGGDEVYVGRRSATSLTTVLTIVTSVTSVILAIYSLSRLR